MRLNEGMQALVRSERTVEQHIMLAVDAAACRGKDALGYQLLHSGKLCAVSLGGHQAWWHQLAVAELWAGVKGRLGELTNQIWTQAELEGSSSVSGA